MTPSSGQKWLLVLIWRTLAIRSWLLWYIHFPLGVEWCHSEGECSSEEGELRNRRNSMETALNRACPYQFHRQGVQVIGGIRERTHY
jgi:hypothetical protein